VARKRSKNTDKSSKTSTPTVELIGQLNYTVYRLNGVIVLLHPERPIEPIGRPYGIAYRDHGGAAVYRYGEDDELSALIEADNEQAIVTRIAELFRASALVRS